MLIELSLKHLYSTICGKNFQIYGVQTPTQSELTSKFLSSPDTEKEFTHSPRQHSFENLFPLTAERGETMIYFIKISSENTKMTWNNNFFILCVSCNFLECDGFTVL